MASTKTFSLLLSLLLTVNACNQKEKNRTPLGKSNAEEELKTAVTDKSRLNVVNNETIIIKDSATAIKVAEPILFSIYGEDNVTSQRPYEIYFIGNHWIINGTLPKNHDGGTFLIILDSRNGRAIKIMHGK